MVSCVYASMLSREGLSMNSCVHVEALDRTRPWRGILKSGDSVDSYYSSYRPWKNTISKQMCRQPSLAFVLTLSTSTLLRGFIAYHPLSYCPFTSVLTVNPEESSFPGELLVWYAINIVYPGKH